MMLNMNEYGTCDLNYKLGCKDDDHQYPEFINILV